MFIRKFENTIVGKNDIAFVFQNDIKYTYNIYIHNEYTYPIKWSHIA